LQEPVDGEDEGDILSGEPHSGQHDDQRDESGLGHSGRADSRSSSRQTGQQGWGRAPGCEQGFGHIEGEPAWVFPGGHEVDERQQDEAVDEEAPQHCRHVLAKIAENVPNIVRGDELSSDEEHDSYWCEPKGGVNE
ncbi:hypothetical protein EGW08_007729, partial [Elysia chlorotica]